MFAMKKAIALLVITAVIISVFSFASCGKDDDNTTTTPDNPFFNYIGDGETAVLTTLVQANAKLVTEVFTLSHLTVDQTKATVINGVKYAPVTPGAFFKSYAELEAMLRSNYTDETVKKILGNPAVYLEKDGVFYYNLDYNSGYNKGEKTYPLKWDKIDISIVKVTDTTIDFLAIIRDAQDVEIHFPMSAVRENGNLRLADYYVIN